MMTRLDHPPATGEFFKAGGTLPPHAPSYVPRATDEQLLQAVRANQLCYVLTTRQMGKSSLMVRTVMRLQDEGIATAIVDLSKLGVQVSAEQWYFGIVKELVDQLRLKLNLDEWWRIHNALGVVQRFADFFNDVLLVKLPNRVVIFFDEIDSTLRMDFTDDFFAAVRVMYNLRASNPSYDRLTFVLLGVASPASLIKDRRRTPFNIGLGIDLPDFQRSDLQPLLTGLEQLYPGHGERLLDRIFYWTNGHPYLTQKVCLVLADRKSVSSGTVNSWTVNSRTVNSGQEDDWLVDQVVDELFLRTDARGEENLQFVRSRIQAYPERRALLQLYRRVWQGAPVSEDERSLLHNELKLAGLVRSQQGALCVRNQIYRRVFDLAWVKENIPFERANLVTFAALAVIVVAIAGFFLYQQMRQNQAIDRYSARFLDNDDADSRLLYLATLCNLRPSAGRQLFFVLPAAEQEKLFTDLHVNDAGDNLPVVVACLQPGLTDRPPAQQVALPTAICHAMQSYCAAQKPPRPVEGDLCPCAREGGP